MSTGVCTSDMQKFTFQEIKNLKMFSYRCKDHVRFEEQNRNDGWTEMGKFWNDTLFLIPRVFHKTPA